MITHYKYTKIKYTKIKYTKIKYTKIKKLKQNIQFIRLKKQQLNKMLTVDTHRVVS